MKKITFEDYRNALDGAGTRLKEIILEHAAQNTDLEFSDFILLCKLANPDPV